MQRKSRFKGSNNYLLNKPKTIWWKVVAGPPEYKLDILQEYDLIFDEYDLKIRKLS